MKILVTGAAGFIGSNFVEYIINNSDHEVIGLDILNYASDMKNLKNVIDNSNRFNFIQGDISDDQLILSIDHEIVVNFAAETHVTRSINNSQSFIYNDVLCTDGLLRSSLYNKKLKQFIHISTSEVYGTCEGKDMSEKHHLNPLSPYAAAKCGADRLAYSYASTYKLPVLIIRPFNNYGPRQHLEKVIPRFITSILQDKPITLHGKGVAKRDFIFVLDTCEALLKVIDSKKIFSNEVFNLGSENCFSVSEISKKIINYDKTKKTSVVFETDRPGQVDKHICNMKKFNKEFNWLPKTMFDNGLSLTYEWYKKNRSWWENKLSMQKIRIVLPNGEVIHH